MEEPTIEANDRLSAREILSAQNSPKLIEEHLKVTNGKVRTRFPPEPNGYLHIGHAKSMNMNFELSFEKLGVPPENRQTFFRYDDTNPEAESTEYITSLAEDVAWLGWKPNPTTFSSDYFQVLYDLAIDLIKKDKAYVCHQTKAEIEACREIAKAKLADPNFVGDACSPYRNRPIEDSLRLFEDMKKGKFSASEATLRLKMDMTSPNPNMWDQVAYRIKYVPHPHAGDVWCIYPTYDYTHCIIDSLEHIDYSICTLEFESRRESYYWVLEALDLYRPKVYEMSRLNMSYTVLSKRKLLKLVMNGFVRGWDDPRMPTIKGIRRRGYTAGILNAFCREIGVTRNENTVQYEKLAAVARGQLHETSPRLMAVLSPLLVVLRGLPSSGKVLSVPDFPHDPSRGSHNVTIEEQIYIDASDFRLQDSEDYFGLSLNKSVQLKYAYKVHCSAVEQDQEGKVIKVICDILPEEEQSILPPAPVPVPADHEAAAKEKSKVKGNIQWVPASSAVPAQIRIYDHLFSCDDPPDIDWESYLNPTSEVVYPLALLDPSIWNWAPVVESHFQFERIGFFVVDKDSLLPPPTTPPAPPSAEETGTQTSTATATASAASLVFNLTVSLKDSKPKVAGAPSRSRKEEQAKQLADKMARMSVSPQEMFRQHPELYSQFDEDGVPTHDAAGEKISKSGVKKLRKDWEKQKKLFESNK